VSSSTFNLRRLFRGILLGALLTAGSSQLLFSQDYYWNDPQFLNQQHNVRFPQALSIDGHIWLTYEQVDQNAGTTGSIFIDIVDSTNGTTFSEPQSIAGPFPFDGAVPLIYWSMVDSKGRIVVAISSNGTTTQILRSDASGRNFATIGQVTSTASTVSPRLFGRSGGGYILFASQNIQGSLSILYSLSDNGTSWTDYQVLETNPNLSLNFNPEFVSNGGREYVAFQSANPAIGANYQIYLKYSDDGGKSWSSAQLLTDFLDPGDNPAVYNVQAYDNQRPYLAVTSEGLAIAWERRKGPQAKQIEFALLDRDGKLSGSAIPVTQGLQTANYPVIIPDGAVTNVAWFDNTYGNDRIEFATKDGIFFRQKDVSPMDGSSTFAAPVLFDGKIYIFWQNRISNSDIRLAYLTPDLHVDPARLVPVDFVNGERSARSDVRIRWIPPRDPSGVAGYSYVWSQDPNAPVPETENLQSETTSTSEQATKDGNWYFRMRTTDYAGNWSTVSTVSYFRDTTPPGEITFIPPNVDEYGYLASNTFTVRWNPPSDKDVAGYSYTLDYLGGPRAVPVLAGYTVKSPPQRIETIKPELSESNYDDGLWALSVSAVDTVGNVGKARTILLRLNKYVPVTNISFVDTTKDALGRITLNIIGRGFTSNGTIQEIILDRDGKAPWDYTFLRSNNAFTVVSDQNIVGPVIDLIQKGTYRVGLVHPERGLYFTKPLLTFETSGTIKFGDFTIHYAPHYTFAPPSFFSVQMENMLFWLILAFLAVVVVFSGNRIVVLVRDGMMIRNEVHALVTGKRVLSARDMERMGKMRRRGIGIRVKFSFFVVVIVVAVVLMVAVILGRFMLDTQRRTLSDGLRNRVEVLLQSVATGASQYLPNAENNVIPLSALTEQMSAVQEAQYVTITGPGTNGNPGNAFNYVWATNDPRVVDPANNPAQANFKITPESLLPGQTRIDDGISPLLPALEQNINSEATKALGDIPKQLSDLSQRILQLVRQTGPQSAQELQNVDTIRRELERRANQQLARIGNVVGSVPTFNPENLTHAQTMFEFYKPIVYLQPNSNVYYHGIVRIAVSTDRILKQIDDATNSLIRNTVIIAMIAVGIGILGALLLATIIVIPIRKLVRGVELIRDTEDKAELESHVIDVRTRDELYTLADVINQMTQGLVKAALASKELTVGKEVQKMFIPLGLNRSGSKGTTGKTETNDVLFFGYYEGAKGVSGDYFDFEKIDDEHYAIIKCDISGKGVPAALIMVEVATIFLNHFRSWSAKDMNQTLPRLVGTVNDLLEERGFKGRFAAFTVVILNVKSGICRVCHAGDNKLHMYDSVQQKLVMTEMPTSPAAGVFSTSLVPNGFPQIPLKLKVGDVLLMFTDGLEEANRVIRQADYQPFYITKEEVDAGTYPPERLGDTVREEFEMSRINDLVNTIAHQGTFQLTKERNPIPDEELTFDFSACEPSTEHMVLGLVSVEKLFRIYADPTAGPDDRVQVDRKVDEFLKKYFRQYSRYFSHPLDLDPEGEYLYFTHIREDEQYDDLTILGIEKK